LCARGVILGICSRFGCWTPASGWGQGSIFLITAEGLVCSATGNSPATTLKRGAGEDFGEDNPDRWVPAGGDHGTGNGNGPAREWDWAGRHCGIGPAWRKWPKTLFSNLISIFYFDF
jgi:hypothetical protein